jgi:hypothetical protein
MIRWIGLSNGRKVIFNQYNQTIFIEGTNVKIYGITTMEQAIEHCQKNLVGFRSF